MYILPASVGLKNTAVARRSRPDFFIIEEYCIKPIGILQVKVQGNRMKNFVYGIEKATKLLGYDPFHNFSEWFAEKSFWRSKAEMRVLFQVKVLKFWSKKLLFFDVIFIKIAQLSFEES